MELGTRSTSTRRAAVIPARSLGVRLLQLHSQIKTLPVRIGGVVYLRQRAYFTHAAFMLLVRDGFNVQRHRLSQFDAAAIGFIDGSGRMDGGHIGQLGDGGARPCTVAFFESGS